MAYQVINNAETGLAIRNKFHNNFNELYTNMLTKATSGIHSSYNSYQIPSADASNGPIEILNLGEQGFSGYDDTANTFLVKVAWSFQMHFNTKWNNTAKKWEYHKADISQSAIEVGAEGVTFHAVPVNTNFSDTWHELLQCRAIGVDGYGPTSGQYNQSKTSLFFAYDSAAYSGNDAHPWAGGSGNDNAFVWMLSKEIKGSSNDWVTFEMNAGIQSAGAISFKKSRGTYASKTIVSDGDHIGDIKFLGYAGAYRLTARIRAQVVSPSASNAPAKLVFSTSATDSSGLTDRMEITESGHVIINSIPTSSAGLAAGTLWNDSGTLKIV